MSKSANYQIDVYLLSIFYPRLIRMLDIMDGIAAYGEQEDLNRNYVMVSLIVAKSLENKELVDLRQEAPSVFENLLGEEDEIVASWPNLRKAMLKFWAKLERLSITEVTGEVTFDYTMPDEVMSVWKSADEIITDLSDISKRAKLARIESPYRKPMVTHSDEPSRGKIIARLEPSSYDAANCVLTFNGTKVVIAAQQKRRGPLHETKEAAMMRLLFKDVNTMRNGVPMRRVVSVNAANFDSKKRKLVKNYIAELNKKITEATGSGEPVKLIVSNQLAVMINSLYL